MKINFFIVETHFHVRQPLAKLSVRAKLWPREQRRQTLLLTPPEMSVRARGCLSQIVIGGGTIRARGGIVVVVLVVLHWLEDLASLHHGPREILVHALDEVGIAAELLRVLLVFTNLVNDTAVHRRIKPLAMGVVGGDALILHRSTSYDRQSGRPNGEIDNVSDLVMFADALPKIQRLDLEMRKRVTFFVDVTLQSPACHRASGCGAQDVRFRLVVHPWQLTVATHGNACISC